MADQTPQVAVADPDPPIVKIPESDRSLLVLADFVANETIFVFYRPAYVAGVMFKITAGADNLSSGALRLTVAARA